MGIKDNFQQALRELTGTEKEDTKRERSIDAMKNAVAAGDTSEFDAIRGTGDGSSFEEIERRAAAAADEYNRQQSAYTGAAPGEPQHFTAPDDDIPPMPDDFVSGSDRIQNTVPGQNIYEQQTEGNIPPRQPAQNMGYNAQPGMNAGYNAQSGAYSGYGAQQQTGGYAARPGYQNPGAQQNTGAQASQGDPTYRSGDNVFGAGGTAGDPANDQYRIFSAARYQHPSNEDEEITVISKNTVIDGNVRSFANMSVDGNIKGNIETTKDIDLNGKIVGNIACNNAQMRTSQIQGNIQMKGNAYMERDTLLIGDLTSTYANVNGKIKGNLDITGKAELKSDAVVFGDISASTITVNDGAIIQGYVSTTFLNKEESKNIFPDTITIGD